MIADATTDPVGSEREESDSEEEDDHSPTPTVSAGLQNVGELRKTLFCAGPLKSVLMNCDKDSLEQTLRKIITKEKIENKNQALFVSLKLLRGDLKQVREENPHLVLGNVSVARKMGFPEVILPGDVRNDLYLTLIGGEFIKGSKSSDKNVEVTVRVCNERGQSIPVSKAYNR
ncbi:hypothetical protein NQ318_007993 [Aromia moschata]|uniref:C2 DOCK-type domain-containing protein n=1 Tax=Aromia moschata TaxID=1265417 RepID=A0AAV8XJJ9_9CUCU|nr:hypothetical protein NQ318_007993 [Aromia moschata]